MLPTYSYLPLQQFISDAEMKELILVTKQEIAKKNLTSLQQLQYEIQLEWLESGAVGQLEVALFPGISSLPFK